MPPDSPIAAVMHGHADDDSGPLRPEKPKRCSGCGGIHGPVGEAFRCLESSVLGLRAEVAAEKARHEATRKLLATFTSRHSSQAEPNT